MKHLLAGIFAVLCAASAADYFSKRRMQDDIPVLYWVTDINPSRLEQVELFHRWLKAKGYPPFELRLDNTNLSASKKFIQGVSGVGADLITMARDEAWLLHSAGIMEDLRPLAEKHGFTLDKTWSAAAPAFAIDGEQVGFPRSCALQVYFLNTGLFEKYRQPLPSLRWTLEEFEAAGKAFVAAANAGREPHDRVFFADMINASVMRWGMGRSAFNETMTRCTLDTPENIRALGLLRKWVHEDRIIPTQADLDFFAGSDTNTPRIQLFARGRYALLTGARYSLVQLREYPELGLEVRIPPFGHFPCTLIGTGSVGIYKKSRHKELAARLLEFFTSEDYNRQVVRSADSAPPIPAYTRTDEYLRPRDHPQEWQVHGEIAGLMELAITPPASPFILPGSFNRIDNDCLRGVLAQVYTPAEAAAQAEALVNREIALNVAADPRLQQLHETLLQDQAEIDRLRAAGRPVPLRLITNPFYRRYYQARGWSAGP